MATRRNRKKKSKYRKNNRKTVKGGTRGKQFEIIVRWIMNFFKKFFGRNPNNYENQEIKSVIKTSLDNNSPLIIENYINFLISKTKYCGEKNEERTHDEYIEYKKCLAAQKKISQEIELNKKKPKIGRNSNFTTEDEYLDEDINDELPIMIGNYNPPTGFKSNLNVAAPKILYF